MNKKMKITIGAVAVAAVLGFGIIQSSASQVDPTLSTDEIRNLVADQYPGTITELELEEDSNKAIYEVEIVGKDKEYQLTLDGDSGEVLHLNEKGLSDHSKEKSDEGETKGDNKSNNTVEKSLKDVKVTMKKAEEIALKEFDGTVTDIDLDEDDGLLIYEVEVHNGKKEAEIEIDAVTGKVIVVSIEQEDNEDDDDE